MDDEDDPVTRPRWAKSSREMEEQSRRMSPSSSIVWSLGRLPSCRFWWHEDDLASGNVATRHLALRRETS